MKKKLLLILSLCLIMACSVFFAACHNGDTHTVHTYENEKWVKVDENGHALKCDECDYIDLSSKESHNELGTGGACSKCGYKKSEVAPPAHTEHTYEDENCVKVDDSYHALKCDECDYVDSINKEKHDILGAGGVCSKCGYNESEVAPPTHTVHTYEDEKWVNVDGNGHALKCDKCDYIDISSKESHNELGSGGACSKCGVKIIETEGLTYELNEDEQSYRVIGIGKASKETNIIIPSKYNGLPVTIVGAKAFYGCRSLTSVTIPSSVISIGPEAFTYCSGLTSVTIPNSVTNICDYAFRGCSGLTSIAIPSSVTNIGLIAFYGCSSLSKVYINDIAAWCKISFGNFYANPLSYGAKLYLDGKLLTKLTIPSEATEINNSAFYGCSGLSEITIPDSVTNIGDDAFRDCSGLTSVAIGDGATIIGNSAFYNCSDLTSIAIGDGVTSIENSAFYECSSLTSVTFGTNSQLTSIGRYAFYNCSLSEITIPSGVTSIGEYAFEDCSRLSRVYINDMAAWCKISFETSYANPLYYAHNLYLDGELVTKLTIPSEITEINDYAFYNCSSLTSVTISDSITSIGNYAFNGCSSLSEITISDIVTIIGKYAFYNCWNLTSITIPSGVTSIGDSAFKMCGNLTSVTFGSNSQLTSIGDQAFASCGSLSQITIPKGVTSIGKYMFSVCSNLSEITIPDSVTRIGEHAFFYCSSLTSITIPDSVTSIEEAAFFYCNSLTSVTFGANSQLTSIGDGAFIECSKLASVTIPSGVTSIGGSVFESCSSLTSITIPDSVTSIGRAAFSGCSKLTTVFYGGTADKWNQISLGSSNTHLIFAAKYYFRAEYPFDDEDEGNYWHYNDNGEPEIWVKRED